MARPFNRVQHPVAKSRFSYNHQNQGQLAANNQQQALSAITRDSLFKRNGQVYLAAPGQVPVLTRPIPHSRVQTHQAPLKQAPTTVNPIVSSAYVLPPPNPLAQKLGGQNG